MAPFTLVTLNILNDRTRWLLRRSILAAQLAELQPDLIALQEVTPRPDNNAYWLADQLGGYEVSYAPFVGEKAHREGLAILSRWPLSRCESIDLQGQSRIAHRAEVHLPTRSVFLATTHLFWWPGESPERDQQARRLLDWLAPLSDQPVMVCGDFNGQPDTRAVRLMRESFASAHALVHGHEPEYTCPTPLAVGKIETAADAWRTTRRKIVAITANRSLKPWRGTLDYVFVNSRLRVLDCQVVLNRPASDNRRIYPSDHFGLMAKLEVGS